MTCLHASLKFSVAFSGLIHFTFSVKVLHVVHGLVPCPFLISNVVLCFHLKVLEEIRVGLELNEYGAQQKRLTHLRFLGELYNYEHVDSSVIFETLYLTLSYGHGTSEVSEPQTISEFNPLPSSKCLSLWFGI